MGPGTLNNEGTNKDDKLTRSNHRSLHPNCSKEPETEAKSLRVLVGSHRQQIIHPTSCNRKHATNRPTNVKHGLDLISSVNSHLSMTAGKRRKRVCELCTPIQQMIKKLLWVVLRMSKMTESMSYPQSAKTRVVSRIHSAVWN